MGVLHFSHFTVRKDVMARLGLMFGVVAMVLTGCSQLAKQSELDRSLATWNALKAENGEHYRYEVSSAFAIIPPSTTTLTVRDGTVVRRSYVGTDVNNAGEEVPESWTEEGTAVGSHDNGSEPITIDEHYGKCQNEVLS